MTTILLVEDDPALRRALRTMMRSRDLDVTDVANGEEAIVIASGGGADVMLLDLGLPDVDGLTLYDEVASRWPDLPVLFSTGHGDQNLLTKTPNGKKVGYLQKPYESDELLAALDELLG